PAAASCAALAGPGGWRGAPAAAFRFDFARGAQGWMPLFSDYPAGEEASFDLQAAVRPQPVRRTPSFFLSGSNHSDDLIMLLERRVTGLRPRAVYRADFEVEFATSVPRNCAGIGGPPGEGVAGKAGASPGEPVNLPD